MPHAEPGFTILHEDEACLVINKPGGVLTQAPPGIDSLEVRLKRYLQQQKENADPYLGVPHRLDRPASGAMVFACDLRTAKKLSRQFENRTVDKTYWALVHGQVAPSQGEWCDYIRKLPGEARSELVEESHPNGRTAKLMYRVLAGSEGFTLLEIELETGRTHQIRVQCAWRGHPVLGDELYGSLLKFGPATHNVREKWIALHARRLAFGHPVSRQRIDITAPLPPWWREVDVDLSVPINA